MKRLAWIRAPFAWKVVRQHDGYTYFENAVTGQRTCRWDGNAWGHIDYSFMRSGDVSYGPFGREVYGRLNGFDRLGGDGGKLKAGVRIGGRQFVQHN
jgi:hypothetical protein